MSQSPAYEAAIGHLLAFRPEVVEATGQAMAADIFRVAASLGHSMDLMLVAEGVESREELELARAAGIHRVQGFALSPPVPASQIPEAIASAEAAANTGLQLRAAS